MDYFIKENGIKILCMDMDFLLVLMVVIIKDNENKVRSMVLESLSIVMVLSMRESGEMV